MPRRWKVLLPILIAAAMQAAAEPVRESKSLNRSITLASKDPGTFFPMSWGNASLHSRPETHCHSYPEPWSQDCELNRQIIDKLSIRLQNLDWRDLEARAAKQLEEIQSCLHGRPINAAPGCYDEPKSNIVVRRYRDQYGGLWRVEAAQGVPSEGVFDGLWADAILERLGPLKIQLGARGQLLSVQPETRRLADDSERISGAVQAGMKILSQ